MNIKMLLAVVLCCFFAGGVFAQSGRKSSGSSSKSSGSYSKSTKADREMTKAKDKIVRQMVRKDFESVKLNKEQKQSLMSMVDSKYPQMVQLDQQMARSIPEDQVKALQRAFRNAKRDGSTEAEAMSMSMEKIGLPEMEQVKVLKVNQSKEDIMESIRTSIVETFDQDQQEAFTVAMAEKKEMAGGEMEDKAMSDEMSDKEMAVDKEMTGAEEKKSMDENMVSAPN